MKFSVMKWQAAAKCVTGAVLLGALLAACGGGGDQIEQFKPQRVVSFGDEMSVLQPVAPSASAPAGATNALKHTVNGLDSAGTVDCSMNALWIQYLAGAYSLVFSDCNPTAATTSTISLAEAGARVSAAGTGRSVTAQIDDFLATGSFGDKTLVTVLAGQNDVLALYALVRAENSTVSEDAAEDTADAIGAALAAQVNRIAAAGGKVVVSTTPNVGYTPFALAEEAVRPGSIDLLTRLTKALNERMRVNLDNDGRKIGLIVFDETIDAVVRSGTSIYASVTAPACNVPSLSCTTNTLVATGAAESYLWADTLWLTPNGHRLLGSKAVERAHGNPF